MAETGAGPGSYSGPIKIFTHYTLLRTAAREPTINDYHKPMNTGDLLSSRYRLLDEVGRGGMGVVYRATDRLLQRQVAVKRVLAQTVVAGRQTQVWSHGQTSAVTSAQTEPGEPAPDAIKAERTTVNDVALANEFRFLASLRHPNIVSVLDFGFDAERHPYYGMDWLSQARTIFDVSRERDIAGRIELIVQVLHALVYLHRQGILHCDLKPSNILVTTEGAVKVLDFGISEYRGGGLDHPGVILGSVAYMAPEVLEGGRPGEASDLYSLGTVMYEMLCGRHPFSCADRAALIARVLSEIPDYAAIADANFGGKVIEVVQRLMSKAPDERYPGAAAVLNALGDIVGRSDVTETVETRESLLQSARFVGRETQMAELHREWRNTCRDARPRFWLVGGESGVGKSRLTDELRIHALVSGALVMRGQAVNRGAASYQLWRDIARYLALRSDLSPFEESVLKAIVPDIASLVDHPVPDAPELEAQAFEERLKRLVVTLLRRYDRPMLLLLEDLQWAGGVNLSLLQRVAEDITDRPIMIVANYRSEETPYLKDLFPYSHHVQLERFSKEELVALAHSVLGEMAIGPVVDMLYHETAGNAFFAVEALRSLAEQAGSLDNVGRVPVSRDMLGGSLDNLIRLKLKRIPAALQRPLQLAAIQGRVIDIAVLEAVSASEQDIALLLSVASAQGILAAHEHSYRFAHDKIREGLIASIDPAAIAGLHEQVATAIERVHGGAIDEHAIALALHWRDAGTRPDKERHFASIAGRQLLERGSYKEAIPHLGRALDLYGTSTESSAPIAELERALGEAVLQRRTDEGGVRVTREKCWPARRPRPKNRRGHGHRSRQAGFPAGRAPHTAGTPVREGHAKSAEGTACLAVLRAAVSHHLLREPNGAAFVRVDAVPQPGGDGAALSGARARLRHHLLQHRPGAAGTCSHTSTNASVSRWPIFSERQGLPAEPWVGRLRRISIHRRESLRPLSSAIRRGRSKRCRSGTCPVGSSARRFCGWITTAWDCSTRQRNCERSRTHMRSRPGTNMRWVGRSWASLSTRSCAAR